MKSFKDILLCIISGIFTALGFIYPSFNFIIWFSLVPSFYVLFKDYNKKASNGFFVMFIYGIFFNLLLYSWLWQLYPLDWCGFTKIQGGILVFFAWSLLSLLQALFPACLGFIFIKLNKTIHLEWFVITLLWIIMEWLQGIGICELTWGHLANSQYNNTYIIQSVSLFGSLFVSGLIVMANAVFAQYLQNKKYLYIVIFFTIFIANFAYGYNMINSFLSYSTNINISLIQANINTSEKWDKNYLNYVVRNYINLTTLAYENSEEGLDLVVWAETAIPIELTENEYLLEECQHLSKEIDADILIGTFEEIDGNTYNAVLKISPDNSEIISNHKQRLVPFGEYIPFKDILEKCFPQLKNINLSSFDLTPAKTLETMSIDNYIVGNLICFDSIFPEIARNLVSDGANFLAVQTNDSWFNGSAALHQHLSQSVLRATENHRYTIRCANTGITAVISPTGEILSALQPLTEGYLNYSISLIKGKTLYTQLGDIIALVSIFVLIIIYIIRSLFVEIFKDFNKNQKYSYKKHKK